MRFLLDMGISHRLTRVLAEHGHEALHLNTAGLATLPDSQILRKAQEEGWIVLTHDLDFADLMAAGGFSLPSIVIFRLQDMRPDNVRGHLLKVLDRCTQALEQGVIVSVNEKALRLRSLPIA